MTTIVVRHGRMAADSRLTVSSDAGGDRMFSVKKIFRLKNGCLVGASGENGPGLVFFRWADENLGKNGLPLYSDISRPDVIETNTENDDLFILVLTPEGQLVQYDSYWVPEIIDLDANYGFYAIGSGAKAAMGAMHASEKLTAKQAVIIASLVDPWTAGPFVDMSPGVIEDPI
jgi:ATP-dependent protease HslVU (ClpYQ) peptidase subunit